MSERSLKAPEIIAPFKRKLLPYSAHRIRLLGAGDHEMADIVAQSRFHGYAGTMKILHREEAERRQEQGLIDDYEYALILALRQADLIVDCSIQRYKAQALAQEVLKQVVPDL